MPLPKVSIATEDHGVFDLMTYDRNYWRYTFAAKALPSYTGQGPESAARACVAYADALLAELEGRGEVKTMLLQKENTHMLVLRPEFQWESDALKSLLGLYVSVEVMEGKDSPVGEFTGITLTAYGSGAPVPIEPAATGNGE